VLPYERFPHDEALLKLLWLAQRDIGVTVQSVQIVPVSWSFEINDLETV
jgi:hypothetical protein